MKINRMTAVALVAACLTTATHAELTDVTVELIDNGMDGITTAQIHAQFDDPDDMILAVYGNSGRPMTLEAPGGLWNDDTGTGIPLDDTPGVGGPFDTWLGFVGDLSSATALFSPDFWGVSGGGTTTSVLQDGVTSLWNDNTSYSLIPGPTVSEMDSDYSITIAQFSFNGTWARMTGSVFYTGGQAFEFNALMPAPGAIALLGMAVLGSPRRRRH